MDPEILAPLILTVVLTLTVGGVLLLRPIAKRLGDIAELMLREKQGGTEGELRRMGDLLETVDAHMTLLEDRQDFTERLLASPDRPKDEEEDLSVGKPQAPVALNPSRLRT